MRVLAAQETVDNSDRSLTSQIYLCASMKSKWEEWLVRGREKKWVRKDGCKKSHEQLNSFLLSRVSRKLTKAKFNCMDTKEHTKWYTKTQKLLTVDICLFLETLQ